jgi:hypothetical protein
VVRKVTLRLAKVKPLIFNKAPLYKNRLVPQGLWSKMVKIPTHLLNIISAGNIFAQMPQLPTKFFSPVMYPKNNKQANC